MSRRLYGDVARALLQLRGGPGSGEHPGHVFHGNQFGPGHAGGRHHGRQAVAAFVGAAAGGFVLGAGRDTPTAGYAQVIEPDTARELAAEGLIADDLAMFIEQHSDLLRDEAVYFGVGQDKGRATLLALRYTRTEPEAGDYFDLGEGSPPPT